MEGERKQVPPVEGEAAKETLEKKSVEVGDKFTIGDETFSFVGVVEDEANPDHGKPVGQLEGEELHRTFTPESLERGVFSYESAELIRDINEEMPKLMQEYWDAECVGNAENNPEGLTL